MDPDNMKQLASDLLMPELDRQIKAEPELWPNIKGLFVFTVAKKKKPQATWYLLLQGKDIQPLITDDEEKAKSAAKTKVRVVRIQVEDSDLINFLTGGMTGVKAYMTGKIKVRGDLMLAQRLEEVFEKVGGRQRALDFIGSNDQLRGLAKAKL
ncbi:SCP2 sterol-binding domain-containing protein [Phascolomyces articulosus]|uniref:SCP2 sterol-binding domain-containing protein n=1 Tax=Phascolomyces articulosus TaxID=60185 RepID=A0AAD5K787_9FUNG|nr:SCP2 sterol-binding domain-containing protein [Phascolomyces articulosus]